PVEIVTELVELAQRGLKRPFIVSQESGGNAIELSSGVVLNLAVCSDLSLELDQIVGAAIRPAQDLKTNRTDHDEQEHDGHEGRKQLRVYPGRSARDECGQPSRQPPGHRVFASLTRP